MSFLKGNITMIRNLVLVSLAFRKGKVKGKYIVSLKNKDTFYTRAYINSTAGCNCFNLSVSISAKYKIFIIYSLFMNDSI